MRVARCTETGEAPVRQGATRENIGHIRQRSNAVRPGCSAGRMSCDCHHRLLGPLIPSVRRPRSAGGQLGSSIARAPLAEDRQVAMVALPSRAFSSVPVTPPVRAGGGEIPPRSVRRWNTRRLAGRSHCLVERPSRTVQGGWRRPAPPGRGRVRSGDGRFDCERRLVIDGR